MDELFGFQKSQKSNYILKKLLPIKTLCDFAKRLSLTPSEDFGLVEKLKTLDFSDAAILDATLVIAYFNFVNRIVLGLGVNLEENAGGYKY